MIELTSWKAFFSIFSIFFCFFVFLDFDLVFFLLILFKRSLKTIYTQKSKFESEGLKLTSSPSKSTHGRTVWFPSAPWSLSGSCTYWAVSQTSYSLWSWSRSGELLLTTWLCPWLQKHSLLESTEQFHQIQDSSKKFRNQKKAQFDDLLGLGRPRSGLWPRQSI